MCAYHKLTNNKIYSAAPASPSLLSSLAWLGQGEPDGLLGLFLNNEDLSVPLIYLCMYGGRAFSP